MKADYSQRRGQAARLVRDDAPQRLKTA